MYRVVPVTLLALTLCACSSAVNTGSLGLNGDTPSLDGAGDSMPMTSRSTTRASRVANLDKTHSSDATEVAKGTRAATDFEHARLNTEEALALINGYRKAHGLGTVKLHTKLVQAAKSHSSDLAKFDRISHFGSDGSNPWERVQRAGYSARLAAENVGTGQTSLEEVMKGWRESESHNKNLLLKGAKHMGIALVRDPKTQFKTFWTLVLGAPM